MGELSPEQRAVAEHYSGPGVERELRRLEYDSPVEFGLTMRALERWVPNKSVVIEVGVGGGAYSELLARKGCSLTLVDISPGLLSAAEQRVRAAGFGAQLHGIHVASATDLAMIDPGSADAVIMLGPLYHLRNLADRIKAVDEAVRVLKQGGVLVAAAINRMAYMRDLLRDRPDCSVAQRHSCLQFLRDGNLDPDRAPPIGYAHLSSVDEFRQLFREHVEELELLGVDSFASPWQSKLANLSEAQREAWLDLVQETAGSTEGLGCSDHFLYVGKRR